MSPPFVGWEIRSHPLPRRVLNIAGYQVAPSCPPLTKDSSYVMCENHESRGASIYLINGIELKAKYYPSPSRIACASATTFTNPPLTMQLVCVGLNLDLKWARPFQPCQKPIFHGNCRNIEARMPTFC